MQNISSRAENPTDFQFQQFKISTFYVERSHLYLIRPDFFGFNFSRQKLFPKETNVLVQGRLWTQYKLCWATNCTYLAWVIDKDVEKHWSQDRPLRNAAHHTYRAGYRAVDHNPLAAIIQPFLYPPSSPAFKSVSLQVSDKDVVQDHSKGACTNPGRHQFPSFLHSCCHSIIEGHQIVKA